MITIGQFDCKCGDMKEINLSQRRVRGNIILMYNFRQSKSMLAMTIFCHLSALDSAPNANPSYRLLLSALKILTSLVIGLLRSVGASLITNVVPG